MYDFKNLEPHPAVSKLPSNAMTFNGQTIEAQVPGYTTLNIVGRETISDIIQTLGATPGQDGLPILGRSLPARAIQIEYRLTAATAADLQQKFRALRAALDKPGIFSFADDPGVFYNGQLEEMGDVPPERLDIVGTYSILCGDPYKYTAPQTATGNPQTVALPSPYQIHPDKIEATLTAAGTKVTIRNITTGRRIILNGSYKIGDKIVFAPSASNPLLRITKNGAAAMAQLDYVTSDFGKFTVKNGDQVDVTPSASLTLTLRGRWK